MKAAQAGSVREALSWRGPLIVALLAVRELMKPLVYWHAWHIFENDISEHIPEPYGKEEAEVRFYEAEEATASVRQQIAAMGELESAEIDQRFAQGSVMAVGMVGGQPAGYMWMVLRGTRELAYDTHWIIREGEALRYGSYVAPAFRGRGLHSTLNHAVICYLRAHHVHTALASVSVLNRQSLSLPKHNKRRVAMTVLVARVRGGKWTLRKAFGAPMGSRFSW